MSADLNFGVVVSSNAPVWGPLPKVTDGITAIPVASSVLPKKLLLLPLVPVFPGVVFSTLFWAGVAWATGRGVRSVRDRRATRLLARGVCPGCGYAVAGLAECPECGRDVGERTN